MGIVNATPDSFSDGGVHDSVEAAVNHALLLIDSGAEIVDIGGESTRPGSTAGTAEAISEAEEQCRVLPVIRGVLRARPGAVVSVDTYRSRTARLAVEAGAEIVNDVSGWQWDLEMAEACAELGCGVVLMHTRGRPWEWKELPSLPTNDVVPMVLHELRDRRAAAVAAGVPAARIALDPGFGFGKRGAENEVLLNGMEELAALGGPLVAGLSRKGFLSTSGDTPRERDAATHAAGVRAVRAGAHVLRVHDVAGARQALRDAGVD